MGVLLEYRRTMQDVNHTIELDDKFKTAAGADVWIHSIDDDGNITADVTQPGEPAQVFDWDADWIVEMLIEGHLIPEQGAAVDYLEV